MSNNVSINHSIQKYILSKLILVKYARFRDMRPENVDTNLYAYHLKLLIKNGFIQKTDLGYTLGKRGLKHADQSHADLLTYAQPNVISILVIQNGYGDVLLYQKTRQPFIDQWTLPFEMVRSDDDSLFDAANRAVRVIGDVSLELRHVGDCYVRVKSGGETLISTFVHVFYAASDEISQNDNLRWVAPHKIDTCDTVPGIDQIIARTYFQDPYFFEEFEENW